MTDGPLYASLKEICARPEPYSHYTTDILWTGEHISEKMLEYHLSPDSDLASRRPDFIDKSASWMKDRFRIGKGTRIADFGCGPGLYTSRFAKCGAQVTGIDFSPRSIAYAKEQAVREKRAIQYVQADYLRYEAPPESFDLICMIYCDFCALSPAQRATMLGKFRELLSPKGSLILDVWTLRFYNAYEEKTCYEPRQMNGFWAEGDYFGFLNCFKYDEQKLVLDKYTIVEPARTYCVYNWLQCYSPETLKAEFEAAGLEISAIYADVAGLAYDENSPCMAVSSRRKA